MAGDWVPGFFYGVPIALEVPVGGASFVLPLVGTGLGVDVAGNQVGVPDTDPESVLIHRLVGQLRLENVTVEFGAIQVDLRFTKGLFREETGTVEVFTENLSAAVWANESFTHERRCQVLSGQNSLELEVDPANNFFDIKSKRSLASAEFYVAVVNVRHFGPGVGSLFFTHYWRHWVTYKGA